MMTRTKCLAAIHGPHSQTPKEEQQRLENPIHHDSW